MAGYVKFYREILDHCIVHKDNDYLAVWMFLLLNANHEQGQCEFNYETITLNPGQLVRGRKQISVKAIVNESKVERILKRFESEHMIEQRKCTSKRLITILNWSLYQKGKQPNEQANEQGMNNERTTDEQGMNTNKNERSIKNERIKDIKDKEVHRFTPPSLIELTDFITSNNYSINAQRFMDFYESKGWMIGKNKMKDWKATVRGWQSRDKQTPQKTSSFLDMLKEEENEQN